MFKYRALLVDTESSMKRPVQAHFNHYSQVADWTEKVLKNASEDAYVEVYTTMETRSGSIKKSDLPLEKHDQVAVPGIQPAPKETS